MCAVCERLSSIIFDNNALHLFPSVILLFTCCCCCCYFHWNVCEMDYKNLYFAIYSGILCNLMFMYGFIFSSLSGRRFFSFHTQTLAHLLHFVCSKLCLLFTMITVYPSCECAMKCCMRFVCVCPHQFRMEHKQTLIKRLVELVGVLFLCEISIKSSRNEEVDAWNGGWMLRERFAFRLDWVGLCYFYIYVCVLVYCSLCCEFVPQFRSCSEPSGRI